MYSFIKKSIGPKRGNIIQLMHSFEVDIRFCQPENSDKPIVLLYDTVSIFLVLFKVLNLLKSDVPKKIISTIYFPNFCNFFEISKIIAFLTLICLASFFVGHRQIVQTQIRCHRIWCLIRVSTVCLHNFTIKT